MSEEKERFEWSNNKLKIFIDGKELQFESFVWSSKVIPSETDYYTPHRIENRLEINTK